MLPVHKQLNRRDEADRSVAKCLAQARALGALTAAQNNAIIADLADPSKTVAQVFGKQTEFWIPNVVYSYWGGEYGTKGRYWVNWAADQAALINKGYYVQFLGFEPKARITITPPSADTPAAYAQWRIDYANALQAAGNKSGWQEAPLTVTAFAEKLTDGTKAKQLAGVTVWGHGGDDGYLLNSNVKNAEEAADYYITYKAWQKAEKYAPGLGILYACLSGAANPPDAIKAGTNVFASNGIFWGSGKTTLVPPLALPAVQKVIRRLLPSIVIPGVVTINPPNVAKILSDNSGIK